MDHELSRLIDQDTPPLNALIANGLAVEHMKEVERYVDAVFRSAARGFPEGLHYVGWERCTPQEEFDENTKIKNNKRTFDVARSDVYMVKYFFSYRGQALPPRYMYLPFVGVAGTITLGGSRFNISPILSDRVISIGTTNIFVRLLRDRLTFERMPQHYMEDGRRQTVQVAWAMIYHKNAAMKKLPVTHKGNCTLLHYLLCKYGFTDTFMKFGKCQPIVGGVEINRTTYPESDWVICSSTGVSPKGRSRGPWSPPVVRVAVRREELTPMVRNMIGGFFYVADMFPDQVTSDVVESKSRWMVLLGHILFSGVLGHGKLHDDVQDHITSLDEYLDRLVIEKLREVGVPVENIYQLFAVVIEHFNDWITKGTEKVASMYDKELSILYYVLYEISSAIFKLYFKLKAASKKELRPEEIIATMNLTLRTGLIYFITKNHGEVTTIALSGDNKATKITSMLVPQSNSNRLSSRKDRAVLSDPSKHLHSSVADVGGYSNLPKSEPSGRSRLNPHIRFDEANVIVRDPKTIELLDSVQEMIKR